MGAYPVMPDDWAQILAAHDAAEGWGPQLVAAALWLDHEPYLHHGDTIRRLNVAELQKEKRFLRMWGYGVADEEERIRSFRETALSQLPPARPPDPPEEPLSNDF
ncbi:MAG: hypothetical protein JWO51_5195 [Rhodospirillales bacterium]|nr:hypothetical protein [Rhodospirillales bacterium]